MTKNNMCEHFNLKKYQFAVFSPLELEFKSIALIRLIDEYF